MSTRGFRAQYEAAHSRLVTSDSFGAQSEAPRIECLREGFGAQYEAAHSRLVTSDSFGALSEAPRIECLREGFGLSGSDGNGGQSVTGAMATEASLHSKQKTSSGDGGVGRGWGDGSVD